MQKIATLVKKTRKKMGLNSRQFQIKIGLKFSQQVYRLEQGGHIPSKSEFKKLAKFMDKKALFAALKSDYQEKLENKYLK